MFEKIMTLLFIVFGFILLFKLAIPNILAFSSITSVILAIILAIFSIITILSLVYSLLIGDL